MFEATNRWQLENEVVKLVQTKGAAWCFRPQLVHDHLLEKHPEQQADVQTLCRVVTIGALAYLMMLSKPAEDQEILAAVARRIQQGDPLREEVLWAVRCWATAIAALPYPLRVQIVTQLKAQAEAAKTDSHRVGTATEERRQVQSVPNDFHRKRQEAPVAEAEAKRQELLLEQWKLAFPKEHAAIKKAADLATQAQVRAAIAKLGRFPEDDEIWVGSGVQPKTERQKARDQAIARIKQEDTKQWRSTVDAENLRRIGTAVDQAALHRKMDAAWQEELQRRQADVERRRIEAQHQREVKEAEATRVKIQEWRQRFPLQSAGVDDDEILRQIEVASQSRRSR